MPQSSLPLLFLEADMQPWGGGASAYNVTLIGALIGMCHCERVWFSSSLVWDRVTK